MVDGITSVDDGSGEAMDGSAAVVGTGERGSNSSGGGVGGWSSAGAGAGWLALCMSRVDAARQLVELQALVTHLQDSLERADVRATLLQQELDEAEQRRELAEEEAKGALVQSITRAPPELEPVK